MGKKGKKKKDRGADPAPAAAQPAQLTPAGALLNRACQLHQQGDLAAAEQAYRQALAADGTLLNGWRNLGAMLRQLGRAGEGRHCTEQALKLDPADASLWGNYGNVLRDQGELEASLQAFAEGLKRAPADWGLLQGQAITLGRLGRHQQVVALLTPQVEQTVPSGGSNALADLLLELGNAHYSLGQMERALACWQRGAHSAEGEKRLFIGLNTAQLLCDRKQYKEARTLCSGLEPLFPGNANLLYAQGVIARGLGDLQGAYGLFERALAREPNYPICLNTFGLMLRDLGRSHQARACFEKALACDPDFGPAMNNLGSVLKDVARYDEALHWLRRGADAMADNPAAQSNVLFTLVGYELEPAPQRFAEAQRFAEKALASHKAGFERHRDRIPDPDPQRRLRLGLVSPDFCRHAVSYFIEPLLEHWDRRQLEVFLYSNGEVRDDYTARLQDKSDHWREIRLLGQEEAIAQILRDEIDILIDLAGHTAGNRLALMAGKPAPIQATYLGYYGTTGLEQVDYWLTDAVLHPPELDAQDPCSEERWRLERPYVSFRPLAHAPAVSSPPCLRNGVITFGSFNQSRKITQQTAEHWLAVLQAVPGSRLLLKSRNLGEASEQERVRALFAGLGLAPERLTLQGHSPTVEQHLAAYSQLDIALDTFPYTGCTTSADALWMGVPVLTVAGSSMVSRQAAAVLTAVGCAGWICRDASELVAKAVQLAADPAALAARRAQQRQQVAASPLLDHADLARATEGAFRQWWHRWLAREGWGTGSDGWPQASADKPQLKAGTSMFCPLTNRPHRPLPLWVGALQPAEAETWQRRGYRIEPLPALDPWHSAATALFRRHRRGEAVLALLEQGDAASQQARWQRIYPQLVWERQR